MCDNRYLTTFNPFCGIVDQRNDTPLIEEKDETTGKGRKPIVKYLYLISPGIATVDLYCHSLSDHVTDFGQLDLTEYVNALG